MYDKDNDIERILSEDIRDKKTAGRGVFNRASRRGYVGSVRTQVDYLNGKAKKEYMKNGDVIVSNIYDDIKNIPSIEQLRAMPDKQAAKNIIMVARSKHKLKELVNHWGFSDNYLYTKFFPEFDIQTRAYKEVEKTEHKEEVKMPETKELLMLTSSQEKEGFTMRFVSNGMKGSIIQDRLTNLLGVLNPDAQYQVKFVITERSE